jgi:hypothetical protein
VLMFQEVLGPQTGLAGDADPRHRCAVRLTAVTTQNAAGQTLVDPLFDINGNPITATVQQPMPVTEIQWSSEDALPFALCVSSLVSIHDLNQLLTNVSVALGNVVLADQGLSLLNVALPTVAAPTLYYAPSASADRCQAPAKIPLPARYRPALADSPLTQAVPLPVAQSPVTANAVALNSKGFVSLVDSDGFVALMIAADAPLSWPQYFGVVASPDAGLFNLEVVFNPPGGPVGVSAPVILERFVGLSLTTGASNYAGTVLAGSRFITVIGSPAGPVPSAFPIVVAMLPNSGTIALTDSASNPYMTIGPTNPLTWPPLFAALTQVQIVQPDVFNLLLLYSPPSGAMGVTLPVTVEQINGVSLAAAAEFVLLSDLITVKTFEEAPSISLAASDLMEFDAGLAVPAISLTGTFDGMATQWTAEPDLLSAGPDDAQFVVEIDTDGTAYLRFGDGTNGRMPQAGTVFTATYRIGNGTAGNVGASSITHLAAGVLADAAIVSCTNPLPAIGGIDPETNAQIRRRAPQAFLTQERAVTMQDYVDVTERNPQVEDAAAVLRWTGSWYTVFITAEPQCNASLSKTLRRTLTRSIDGYRLAGQDILLEGPQYISLDIALTICVAPTYFRRDVQLALQQVLGSGALADGQPALFAPQNFELGQTVYLSPIYTAARSVEGVQTVTATVFEPQGVKTQVYVQQGFIPMGAFQVARMDNDPSLPDHGQLRLNMQGGR